MPLYPTAERGVKKNWRLCVLTQKYDRAVASSYSVWSRERRQPGWLNVNREYFEIPNRTEIGAKRIASRHLENDIQMPKEESSWHRESMVWTRWFPLCEVPNSYKLTSVFSKYHLRAELLEVTE